MALKNEEARVEELRRDGRAGEAEARVLNRADGSESVPCGGPKAVRTGGGADWSESVNLLGRDALARIDLVRRARSWPGRRGIGAQSVVCACPLCGG